MVLFAAAGAARNNQQGAESGQQRYGPRFGNHHCVVNLEVGNLSEIRSDRRPPSAGDGVELGGGDLGEADVAGDGVAVNEQVNLAGCPISAKSDCMRLIVKDHPGDIGVQEQIGLGVQFAIDEHGPTLSLD